MEPDLASSTAWDDWLRNWATGVRDRFGSVGEQVLVAVRTSVDVEALRIADSGLQLMTDAGFEPAEAGYALWLALRVACTAGPAGAPTVHAPLNRVADQLAGQEAPSVEMADALEGVAAGAAADAWRFDLECAHRRPRPSDRPPLIRTRRVIENHSQ